MTTTGSPLDRLINRPERTEAVTFALDPNESDRLRDARQKVNRAQVIVDREPTNVPAAERLTEAEEALAELEASIVTIRFDIHAIGPARVEELMAEHKPTKEQATKARKAANGDPAAEPAYNEDTFPQVLLAEAVTAITASDDPGNAHTDIDQDDIDALWASAGMSHTDKVELFNIALYINQASSSVGDLGKD